MTDINNAPDNGQANTETNASDAPWYGSLGLPDEDIGYIQNKQWDSPVKVVTAYKELEKFRGVPENQLAKIPAKPDDAEGWNKLYEKLGRPADSKGYQFKPDEGMNVDANRLEWFSTKAHELGLNQRQYETLVKEAYQFENGALTAHQEAEATRLAAEDAASMDKLKTEWGSAYNERLELGRRAFRSFADGDAVDKLEDAIGKAEVLKMFSNIGAKLGEQPMHEADSNNRPYGNTPEQAKADIKALKDELGSDPKRLSLYNTQKGADYAKMQSLLKIAHS